MITVVTAFDVHDYMYMLRMNCINLIMQALHDLENIFKDSYFSNLIIIIIIIVEEIIYSVPINEMV